MREATGMMVHQYWLKMRPIVLVDLYEHYVQRDECINCEY